MKTFWTSVIIFNNGDIKPWLCAISSPQFSLERAMKEIEHLRKNHNVLAAWIDTFDENNSNKEIVFHECYM